MYRFFIATHFTIAFFSLILWVILALLVRAKSRGKREEEKPAGLWARLFFLGVDLSLIDIISLIFAYHGRLNMSAYLTLLIGFGYFFFFLLFFSSTPGKMLACSRVLNTSGEGGLKPWQILVRTALYPLMPISWISALFNKQKRTIHDLVCKTRVAYSKRARRQEKGGLEKILAFAILGLFIVLFFSLVWFGWGEKITQYAETDKLKLFDINLDGVYEGVLIDSNGDGLFEVVKYDIDNDRIIDFTAFDLDGDEATDVIDKNNDGKIDGYDWNSDGLIDETVFSGVLRIWLWKIWFIASGLGWLGLFVLITLIQRKKTAPSQRAHNRVSGG